MGRYDGAGKVPVILNNTRGDSRLVTNVIDYDVYRPLAVTEYEKKKMEEHKAIHEEIKRISTTELIV